ncbi:MAG TPA: sigma-70 family RNA polymerase sigma factor, partial [Jiangellales bacterium]|nr:sigma-70 family RNA polymerase sigma factor [Jiangellales bacterium]
TTDRLTRELGRSPTAAEVARTLEVSEDEVLEALESSWAYHAASLDAPATDDGDAPTLAERLGEPESSLDDVDARESLRRVVGALPVRERRILTLRFFGERTQAEIAQELGISQMHVSRLIARTLARLREHLVDGAPLPVAWSSAEQAA